MIRSVSAVGLIAKLGGVMSVMGYEEEIRSKLADPSLWPMYSKPEVLAKLDTIADDALSQTNIDTTSCIASILILQQITEELLKVLLHMSHFLIQAKLLPLKIQFKVKPKAMFGEIVKQLDQTIAFEDKDQIIELANNINAVRIDVAHKLIEKEEFDDLTSKALLVREYFEVFFTHYNDGIDWMRLCLNDLRKDSL